MFLQVREKYSSSEDFSWSSAADEVKVELLNERYENGGRKLSDDPLLVLLKKWPASEKCWKNPRLIESQVKYFLYYLTMKTTCIKLLNVTIVYTFTDLECLQFP